MDDGGFGRPCPGDQPSELDLVYEDLRRTQDVLRKLLYLIDSEKIYTGLAAPVLSQARKLAA